MRKKTNYQYYVEGEDELKLLNTLKSELRSIQIGKVDKFNVVQKRFNIARIRTLKQDTVVSNVGELTRSRTKKDFKRDLIRCTNLGERLKDCNFDISKLWNHLPKNKFSICGNGADKVKILK